MRRNKTTLTSLLVGIITFSIVGSASAHVTVKPAEVATAGFQTFTMSVPNEKDIPTTRIKLVMPAGLQHVAPTNKSGWQIDIEKDGEIVKSITWKDGAINDGFRDDFTFSAQVPAQPTELQWKAYQTYSDGTVVSWDQSSQDKNHNSQNSNQGPFSVTKVVASTETTAPTNAVDDISTKADRALYVGVAGVIVGLFGIFVATRKRA